MNPKVNRSLADKTFDNIDHALGRPVDPMTESYRDHFAATGELAAEMAKSPYWNASKRPTDPGAMRYFYVSLEGRKALKKHLQEIGDEHKTYEVWFEGFPSVVAAQTAAKARYAAWLRVSDCAPDLTFIDFSRKSRVRRPGADEAAQQV